MSTEKKKAFLFEMEMGTLGKPFQQGQTLKAQQDPAGKARTQSERFSATRPNAALLSETT